MISVTMSKHDICVHVGQQESSNWWVEAETQSTSTNRHWEIYLMAVFNFVSLSFFYPWVTERFANWNYLCPTHTSQTSFQLYGFQVDQCESASTSYLSLLTCVVDDERQVRQLGACLCLKCLWWVRVGGFFLFFFLGGGGLCPLLAEVAQIRGRACDTAVTEATAVTMLGL